MYQPYNAPRYPPVTPPAKFITVGTYDNYFVPKTITIQSGMTVRWVNYGRNVHTVTSRDSGWGSGDIPPGASYSATFQYPGTYAYYCRHHTMERMEGSVVVRSGSSGPVGGYAGSESSGYQQPGAKKGRGADTAGLIRHGEYLVNEVAHCSVCHTPPGSKGQPDRSRLLQGTVLPIEPKKKTENWADRSPDITSSGLAGKWSEQDFIKFLMTGVDPDGKTPRDPMPKFHLNARDARAVALYVKSLPGSRER
jgi:mono/diheme cytochrome c family protein